MNGDILVIDHPYQEKLESYFIGSLRTRLSEQGFFPVVKNLLRDDLPNHVNPNDIRLNDFVAVIFASGFSKIVGNHDLLPEWDFMKNVEKLGLPTLYEPHAMQIRAVETINVSILFEASKDKQRTGVHTDYIAVNDGEKDPIFKGVNVYGAVPMAYKEGDLSAKEYHKWNIGKIGSPFKPLLLDSDKLPIVATHSNNGAAIYMMQIQPEYEPKLGEIVNGHKLLENWLEMVKQRLQP